jgi:hypothetical protein
MSRGVDYRFTDSRLTMSAEPFKLAMKRMNDVMDKIEAIIKK